MQLPFHRDYSPAVRAVVTSEAFVIHALAPDGSRIVTKSRPDEATGVIEQTGSSASSGNWNGGSSNSDNSTNR